jgi:hypothetical protein
MKPLPSESKDNKKPTSIVIDYTPSVVPSSKVVPDEIPSQSTPSSVDSDPDRSAASSYQPSVLAMLIPTDASTSAPSITKGMVTTVVPSEKDVSVDTPDTESEGEEGAGDDAPASNGAAGFLAQLATLQPFAVGVVAAAIAILFLVYRCFAARSWATRAHEVVQYSQLPQGDIEMLHTLRSDDEAEEELWSEWESDNEGTMNAMIVTDKNKNSHPDKAMDGSSPHRTSAPSTFAAAASSTSTPVAADKISMSSSIPSRNSIAIAPMAPASMTSRATSRSKERKQSSHSDDVDLFEVR